MLVWREAAGGSGSERIHQHAWHRLSDHTAMTVIAHLMMHSLH